MRVSVIVPALEEQATIGITLRTLQSARATGEAEVIVVDGGSRDATAEAAAPLADVVVRSARGRAVQMNAGAALARGEVLLFLHADTQLPAHWLPAIREALAGGRDWGRFDVIIDGSAPVLKLVARMMNLRSRLTCIATGDQAMFVRRAAFTAVGGFPPIALMEDIALSRALKRGAGRPACLPLAVRTSARRWERHGPWRTIAGMWKLRLLYFLGADPARLAEIYRQPPTHG